MMLTIKNLKISFLKNKQETEVVRGLNLDIFPGEMLGVVGESGSGKSLTNLAIMGLLPRFAKWTASHFSFKNHDLLNLPPKQWQWLRGKEMSMIFQDAKGALDPSMTLQKQLLECVKKNKPQLDRKKRLVCAMNLLEQVGLCDFSSILNSYPHQLSGGMAQRFNIAMALASNPSLLIADEITTGLDPLNKHQILTLLNNIRKEKNMAILMVSHDLFLIQHYAQRVVVLYSGECMESGPISILEHPAHPYTQGLIQCLPRKRTQEKRSRLQTIEGTALPIGAKTSGCRFSNRCILVHNDCLLAPRDLPSVGHNGHVVNCHLFSDTQI